MVLPYINMNPPWVYTHIPNPEPPSHLPPHSKLWRLSLFVLGGNIGGKKKKRICYAREDNFSMNFLDSGKPAYAVNTLTSPTKERIHVLPEYSSSDYFCIYFV